MTNAIDIMDTHPIERIEKLENIRIEKKQFLASKKKELDVLEQEKEKEIEELDRRKNKELENFEKKKKELMDLEKKKAKEIEETEDLIDQSFQDLMRHKKMLIAENETLNKKNLEQLTTNAPNILQKNVDYGKFFEKLEVPEKLYDITNKGFYDNLNHLRDRALSGELTPQEETFIEQLREKFESFNQPDYLNQRDDKNYVQRSLNVIKDIDVSIYYR